MSSCRLCWSSFAIRKLTGREFLRKISHYRSIVSCCSSANSLVVPINHVNICKKPRYYVGYKYFSASTRKCDISDNKTSIAVSQLKEKDVPVKNTLAEEIEKGLQELKELANTKIKISKAFVPNSLDESSAPSIDKHTTTFRLPRSGNQVFELYGTPDPRQPVSDIPCHGCGALFHCRDPGIPGYLPSQSYLAVPKSHLKDCLCQRCQLLKTNNIALDLSVPLNKYNPIIREVRKHKVLVLLLVDMTDLSNSFHKTFKHVQSFDRPIYVIGNKIDLIPKDADGYLERAMESLVETANQNGFSLATNVNHFALVSGKSGYGIEDLITKLLVDWRLKGQVFIMGCANCGKSTLFNALLASDFCRSSAREMIHRATTSVWPGTTLNLLKFPIVNPKPRNLYEREKRLNKERSEWREEHQLNKCRDARSPNLLGKVGSTFRTPREAAITYQAPKNVGYLVPSYSGDGDGDGRFVESLGKEGAVEYLNVKPLPYNDSTFKYWCYDTPGLINPDQIINQLNQAELLSCVPQNTISCHIYSLKPGKVIFVSGLSRIDYLEGSSTVHFTVFTSLKVPVIVVNENEADEFYKTHIGTEIFGIPKGDADRLAALPPLVGTEYEITGCGTSEAAADIVLSSLGWVSVSTKMDEVVRVKAYTPGGAGCKLRTLPLVRYDMALKDQKGTSRQ